MGTARAILDLFNVMVVEKTQYTPEPNIRMATEYGVVTNFTPTQEQAAVLLAYGKPLDVRTLFTPKERRESDVLDLIRKQILHYIEVYGLGMEGNLTVPLPSEKVMTVKYVRGVTRTELQAMVHNLIYKNMPIKDTVALRQIIDEYGLSYDIQAVENNELRVLLFDPDKHVFKSGDDAVRWMCYAATESPLLIKSREVIDAVRARFYSEDCSQFLKDHENQLAKVFNRHKKIILAMKRPATKTVINRITRKSKRQHVPLVQPVAKHVITTALKNDRYTFQKTLGQTSVRDRLKFLNLLAYKKTQQTADAFNIRNGKIFVKEDRKVFPFKDIIRVEEEVLTSLANSLSGLHGKQILLDKHVDYGLPVTRKQTMGHLPYGTTVTVDTPRISAGIYWHNDGGAHDLDLSSIDKHGGRVGWGQASGYNHDNIIFSGDVTNATKGAMEFMTSWNEQYGLFVNIYAGDVGSEMELVVGTGENNDTQWIQNPIIREKCKLESKGCLIGYVNQKSFVVYNGRVSGRRISSERQNAVAARGTYDFWTVKKLLPSLGINYTTEKQEDVTYDHDLSYEGFSYDKLEGLLM